MRKLVASALLSFLPLIAMLSWGQSANLGAIEGTITDASGAVVPGVSLSATNPATRLRFSTQSNDDGIFRFAVVPVGTYDLKAQKQGFATLVEKGIAVNVGSKVNLDLKLPVAGVSETVEVTGEPPLVETTRTKVSTTVNATAVADLPVNGRNFLDFMLLTPGVTRDVRTGDLSFAGQRGTLNSLTVDGADDNNTFFGQTTGRTGSGRAPYQFSQDAVQEFQVNSNGYSAELGRAGGAVINVVTKSGSNDFHGTGFWFYRDHALAANDPIRKLNNALRGLGAPSKPPYHFNQFGGNVGGPMVRNRVFFFFDYDGQRNTQPNVVTFNVPVIASPTLYQQQALAYLAARSNSWLRGLNQNTYLTKGDLSLNARNQLSVRWNRQNFTGLNFENGSATQSVEHTGSSIVNTDTVAAQLTSTLTNHIVNIGRFSYQIDSEPGRANSNLPEATVLERGQALLTVGRNSFSPRETTIHRQQYADTVNFARGRHTVKLGADLIHDDILNFFPGNFSGVYTFNSLENFGRSLAGVPLTSAAPGASGDRLIEAFAGPGTSGPTTHPNIFELSWFVQDDWRVNNHLTLNLGLRHDLQKTARPPVANPAAAAAGIQTDRLNTDTNNFGPRLGVAWTPRSASKLVVSGGYGLFYGRTPSIMVGTAHSNNGISVQTKTFTGVAIPSYPGNICGAPAASPSCPAPATGQSSPPTIFVMQPNFQEPVVQQANLAAEYEVAKDWSVMLGGLMVKGNHLQRTRDVNLGTPAPIGIPIAGTGQVTTINRYPSARPIAAFSRILQFESSANSLYDGLILQLRKRFSHNFELMTSYTWSHVIDDAPDATAVVPGTDDSKMPFDPRCPACDRASSVNDQRHRFVLSGIWQLQYGNGMSRVPKAILGGWEISTILSAQTGQPYTGLVNSDLNNDGNRSTDRAGQGRNTFNLPATWSLDPRLTKNVNFAEKVKMQLLVEAFNLFNHFNVYGVRTTQYSLIGGQLVPQTAGLNAFQLPVNAPSGSVPAINLNGARVFQLGAKVSF